MATSARRSTSPSDAGASRPSAGPATGSSGTPPEGRRAGAPSLRARLVGQAVGVVALAFAVTVAVGAVLAERAFLQEVHGRAAALAAAELAGELYGDRLGGFVGPEIPTLPPGTFSQLLDHRGHLLWDSRDGEAEPGEGREPVDVPLASVRGRTPAGASVRAQEHLERVFADFERCARGAGLPGRLLEAVRRPAGAPPPWLADETPLPGERELRARERLEARLATDDDLDRCALTAERGFAEATASLAAGATHEVREARGPDGGRVAVAVLGVVPPTGPGPVFVAVATDLAGVDRRLAALRTGLAVSGLTAVVLVGLVSWLVAGRSLRPVDRMIREVEAIAATTLDRRVPVPGSGDEIARLARTMNEMLDRLESSARSQRGFVADASHELRSPIASIRAQAEVALAHPDRGDLPEILSDVLAEARRMQTLVDQLLTLARVDEQDPGALVETHLDLDLDDVVFTEARRLETQLRPEIAVDTRAVSGGRVRGNPEQLRRVVRNLLENASRYARSEIRIGLHAEAAGPDGRRWVRLVVDDDGRGVKAEDRERIFERFSRSGSSRSRRLGGAGLGLALVRGIVEVHGGTVTVDRSIAGGASFVVRLPGT